MKVCPRCKGMLVPGDAGDFECIQCGARVDPRPPWYARVIYALATGIRKQAVQDVKCKMSSSSKEECREQDANPFPTCYECKRTAKEYLDGD